MRSRNEHGPDLEEGGVLAHVGVADDDVQPAIALGVSVGFVTGVDDGPRAGRRGRHAFPDVLGPLAMQYMAPRAVWSTLPAPA